ncbi:hypothetical protein B6A42_08700 [Vibrio coralliilyticus]|nr:hypothetical protein B6A42_08700 [Vibrio coralliilyticus]
MANNFQDDSREAAMIELFGLYKDVSEGRTGIDAFLNIDGKKLPFELKTTSQGSVTTVRDFGPEHIKKWEDKHWLIGFYMSGEEYYKYVSPEDMKEWIDSKAEYIRPDFELSEISAKKLSIEDLHQVVGNKSEYSYEDAKKLHKNQYSKADYLAQMDLENGYSPERMLGILKDRMVYISNRGSTLNNPHIPFSYFKDFEKIDDDHAEALRRQVRAKLK